MHDGAANPCSLTCQSEIAILGQEATTMREKDTSEIYSVSQDLVQGVIKLAGPPDLIIESADATFRGMPDLEADPPTREVMDRLRRAVERLPIIVEDGQSPGD